MAQARTMKSSGASMSEIAEAHGVSRSTVCRHLNAPNGHPRAK
ncbi:helix-turn-helix domain-containing protein [Rhodococcus globerulus]